jgi:rare lipoprotein A
MIWMRFAKSVVLATAVLVCWPRGATAIVPLQIAPRNGGHPLDAQTVQHRTVQFGVASYYGAWHRGRLTASGVPFDDRKLTAAHRTLPLGTHVQVTNLKNGRSVIVKINDRGPYVRHRLIDLSAAAARVLGFRHRGVAPVKVRVIKNPPSENAESAPTAAGQAQVKGGGGL